MSGDFDFDDFFEDLKAGLEDRAPEDEPSRPVRQPAQRAGSQARPAEKAVQPVRRYEQPKSTRTPAASRKKPITKRWWFWPAAALFGLSVIVGAFGEDDAGGTRSLAAAAAVEATQTPEPTATPEPTPSPEPTPKPSPTPEPVRTYVLNTNSGVFHSSSCSYARRMSDANKWEYEGTRSSVIEMGYVPCEHCNP